MLYENVEYNGICFDMYTLNTVVVGTGAAGLNAADRLYSFGQSDIAIVSEGLNMGTSRNTGSDKQTYYKLTLAGNVQDSIGDMARTLFDGGSMHGDIALTEAALSAGCFYHLVDIGVGFPHNVYGEYAGYKTDHDPRQRAVSAGPLTSKIMTEKLQQQVFQKGIKIFDRHQVIAILTDRKKSRSIGLLALNISALKSNTRRYAVFNCTNIVYAAGGPAGIYMQSVYPPSQTGSTGIALEAGAEAINLTESQYGIASVKFRWNLSGTYQQVLPRYVSLSQDGGDEKDFLEQYFKDSGRLLDAVFLKGYQWPFDPAKVTRYGSSLIDVLVYHETMVKGRRVFLDYSRNPTCGSKNNQLNYALLGKESYNYLKKSNALFGKPIDRLKHMNYPAIELYKNNQIDIEKDYLEIAVCAQHNNGGLAGNIWWESNLRHFFPVGEVNGSHGVYRPGGSALNSGQVGAVRAAQYIVARYTQAPLEKESFLQAAIEQIAKKVSLGDRLMKNMSEQSNLLNTRQVIGKRMSAAGAHIRQYHSALSAAVQAEKDLLSFHETTRISKVEQLPYAFQNYDLMITQYVYLMAIVNYIQKGGQSRGSYLVYNKEGQLPAQGLPEGFRFKLDDGSLAGEVQQAIYKEGKCFFEWKPVRPIPESETWFENVWNAYMSDEIIK